jgi:exodeoxyribonuclease VII large subunit
MYDEYAPFRMSDQLSFELGPVQPRTHTVSEVVALAARALEARFASLWVEGEVSNLRIPASGHVYFTLKDEAAQLQAVMFAGAARRLRFRIEDGLSLRCRGRLSIYEAQGKFQILVDAAEPAGVGALQLAFEQLKARLAAEGLFDPARKRPLPFLPRVVGVVTSESGAAIRDIVRVIQRRFPARILLAPAAVQGDEAPGEIVRALDTLSARDDVDVIIVGRGGGSMEDLWAFNDERVARAIAACPKPVVSAVGHEIDFCIADFVADLRAPTPSAAGERVVPEDRELRETLDRLVRGAALATARRVRESRLRLDDTTRQLGSAAHRVISNRRRRVELLDGRLKALHPRARIAEGRTRLERLRARLHAAAERAVAQRRGRLGAAAGKLDSLSPLRVLERGYSLCRGPDGRLLTNSAQVEAGDEVAVRLRNGELDVRVERTRR